MSEEKDLNEKEQNNIIELTDDEGNVIKCELYDIIEFDKKNYAVLTEVNDKKEEPEMVLMRYVEEKGESYFETIDNDEEFDKVTEYIESLEDEEDIYEDIEE